jgi:predicted SAM-dependent methyltransferase
MPTLERLRDRKAFAQTTRAFDVKIQMGIRGKENGPDWLAVGLLDDSPVIDAHWDIRCLSVADASVDCFVCNAVLEHVSQRDLALSEMFRSLRTW